MFMHVCKVCSYSYAHLQSLFIYLCPFVKFGSYIYVHMYHTVPVHNIYTLTSLWSVCAGHTCAVILSLTHPHRNSSPRGLVTQGVDGDIQGAKPPYHSKRLDGLTVTTSGYICIYINIFGS